MTASLDVVPADRPNDPVDLAGALEGSSTVFRNSEANEVLAARLGPGLANLVDPVATASGEAGALRGAKAAVRPHLCRTSGWW